MDDKQATKQLKKVPDGTANNDLQNIFGQMVEKIIEHQEAIIGPVAIEQAKHVKELKVDWANHSVGVSGNPQKAVDELVAQYKELFGQIAVETCKEAAASALAKLSGEQVPTSLR